MFANAESSALLGTKTILMKKKLTSKSCCNRANNIAMISGASFFLFGTIGDIIDSYIDDTHIAPYMYFFCAFSCLASAVITTISSELNDNQDSQILENTLVNIV